MLSCISMLLIVCVNVTLYGYVAGNTSILSWFFHETGPVLLTDASLSSNLTINDDHTAWTISVEGIHRHRAVGREATKTASIT